MGNRVHWPIGVAIAGFFLGLLLGWNTRKVVALSDHLPIIVQSTNTVTNVVTKYVLDIDITAVEGDGWTQKMVLRHHLKDSSKPFMVEEEK